MPRSAYDITPVTTLVEPILDQIPVATSSLDAEVDVEVLRSVPKQFSVEDEKSANWLVKKIVAAREYADRVKEWAAQEVRRAEREESTLSFLYLRQLEGWARGEVEKLGGRRKSLALPAGTVGFRFVGPALRVDDEMVVLGWAKHHCPPAIKVVESLSRAALKQHFESTGDLPDGAHVEPASEKFFVR